ncbi:MAG: MoxR family ATPase [Actinobacteria bacterium]|nr:MoxR family ATPase [Actinomycetota bacterium]
MSRSPRRARRPLSLARSWTPRPGNRTNREDHVTHRFASPEDVAEGLRSVDYLPDARIARTIFLADRLEKPVLVEGPAGVGKTELAKSLARLLSADLIRLQCYEGLDEAKALYEWNYKKQLLRIQADQGSGRSWDDVEEDIFAEGYLLERPLLRSIRSTATAVLLIDEVDRVEAETEALMLEVLSEFQVSIPELGTVTAGRYPLVLLTSNNTRDLSEALKRRCLFLHLGYPQPSRERDIVRVRVPDIGEHLADQLTQLVARLRTMDLKKKPAISETIDWARTLVQLGADELNRQLVEDTLNVLLKYEVDIERAVETLLPTMGDS